MDGYANAAAVIVSAIALYVSYLSWRTSVQSVRAATFDQRYQVYSDAETFLGAWIRDAHPDMTKLNVIVGAWRRSHFLCSDEVTRYLRKVWLDAVKADYSHKVIAGEAEGDRKHALKETQDLLVEHLDFEKLRRVFTPDLKV